MLFKGIAIIDENYNLRENKYVIVQDDTILAIGDVMPKHYTGDVYDGKNKILAPGFYNTHCHVPMTLLRGYGEGLPLQRWLTEKIFPYEELLTDEDIYYGSLLGIAEMISSGCVSFTEMYFKLENICQAVDQSGMKANICYGFFSSADSTDGLEKVAHGISYVKSVLEYAEKTNGRIICDAGIHAEYSSNVPLVNDVVELANDNNLRMHIHLSETQKEQQEALARRGMTPAAYFEKLGVFNRPTNAAHCVWLDKNDYEILAKNNVTVAHCSSSNLKLGSGIANVKEMINAGINVTIGTDGAASNNNLNMLEEVNLAAMVQKGVNMDSSFITNDQLLTMACKNGAEAQGRNNSGSIKVDHKADLVVYNTDSPHMQPVIDGVSNLLYASQASDISLTMIDGKIVYKDGEFKTIDIEKVKHEAGKIAKNKLGQL